MAPNLKPSLSNVRITRALEYIISQQKCDERKFWYVLFSFGTLVKVDMSEANFKTQVNWKKYMDGCYFGALPHDYSKDLRDQHMEEFVRIIYAFPEHSEQIKMAFQILFEDDFSKTCPAKEIQILEFLSIPNPKNPHAIQSAALKIKGFNEENVCTICVKPRYFADNSYEFHSEFGKQGSICRDLDRSLPRILAIYSPWLEVFYERSEELPSIITTNSFYSDTCFERPLFKFSDQLMQQTLQYLTSQQKNTRRSFWHVLFSCGTSIRIDMSKIVDSEEVDWEDYVKGISICGRIPHRLIDKFVSESHSEFDEALREFPIFSEQIRRAYQILLNDTFNFNIPAQYSYISEFLPMPNQDSTFMSKSIVIKLPDFNPENIFSLYTHREPVECVSTEVNKQFSDCALMSRRYDRILPKVLAIYTPMLKLYSKTVWFCD